jgi:hypothetical protein
VCVVEGVFKHEGLPTEACKTNPAQGPQSELHSDLWENATGTEWEVAATYLEPTDQDQSLHW